MKHRIALLAVVTVLLAASSHAALKPGDAAPDFKTQASLAGNVFTFSLAEALKKGPVVLYFYPAAFTSGCTIEAHDFAEAVRFVSRARRVGDRGLGRRHQYAEEIFRERMPRQVCGCRGQRQEHHEVL